MAMNRASTMAAASALIVGTVLGCGQIPAAPSTSPASTRTQAPATSTPLPLAVSDAPDEGDSAQRPVAFTGRILCGDSVRTGVSDSPADVGPERLATRGWAWQPTATMSDPRLEGDYYISYDSDDYPSPTVFSVGTGTWRIQNGEGAWQGSFTNIRYPDSTTTVSTALLGEGAYAGMTAVWESTHHQPLECAWAVRGLILVGLVPPAPEPYIPEE